MQINYKESTFFFLGVLAYFLLSCKQSNSCKDRSLGQVENARQHICFPGHQADHIEVTKLERVEKHIGKCNDARRNGDWRSMLREADAAVASGADASPQVRALLKV